MKGTLHEYYQNLSGRIQTFLSGPEPDTEQVHKARIAMKKLRALYRMLEALDGDFSYQKANKPL